MNRIRTGCALRSETRSEIDNVIIIGIISIMIRAMFRFFESFSCRNSRIYDEAKYADIYAGIA